jgi:hypothetical protein
MERYTFRRLEFFLLCAVPSMLVALVLAAIALLLDALTGGTLRQALFATALVLTVVFVAARILWVLFWVKVE